MSKARELVNSPANWAEIDRGAKGVVYRITHIDSGAEYIGSTTRALRQRVKEHRKDVRDGSLHPLHVAIRSFGWQSFFIDILEYVSNETIRHAEIHHINNNPSLFNQAKGGLTPYSNWSHTEHARDLVRQSKIGVKNAAARAIEVNGVRYGTVMDGCAALGISFPTIRNRLVDPCNCGYKYVEAA